MLNRRTERTPSIFFLSLSHTKCRKQNLQQSFKQYISGKYKMMKSKNIKIWDSNVLPVGDDFLSEDEFLFIESIKEKLKPFALKVNEMQGEIIIDFMNDQITSIRFVDVVEHHQLMVLQILNLQK